MGWIGVDLFFVLSGFLVSGLLIQEYKRNHTIRPIRFLIRRGFKIYPLYYFFVALYAVPLIVHHLFHTIPFIGDLVFLQNYISGWGYTFAPGWSLAVEEHFYIALAALSFLVTTATSSLLLEKFQRFIKRHLIALILGTMVLCLILRIISNIFINDPIRLNTMTHLRIDTLLIGVLISIGYYFSKDIITQKIQSLKKFLLLITFACISFTPFLDPLKSVFERTFGFTLIAIGFGSLLTYFLYTADIYAKLVRLFGNTITKAMVSIGTYSYAIYLVHTLVNTVLRNMKVSNPYAFFALGTIISIFLGMLLTKTIEAYFLKQRARWFPQKVSL